MYACVRGCIVEVLIKVVSGGYNFDVCGHGYVCKFGRVCRVRVCIICSSVYVGDVLAVMLSEVGRNRGGCQGRRR